MLDRLSRFAPLTGVVFAVLTVVAVLTEGETPKASASPAKVIAYYAANRSEAETSSILFGVAFVFLLLFASSLRSYLRRTPVAEGLGALVLASGVLMAAGSVSAAAVEYGLAHNLSDLTPQAAQVLNVLSKELVLTIVAGAFVFAIASGLAILRGAQLPKWLGWVSFVLAIAVVIPPAALPALFGFVVWSAIVSILIYLRTGPATPAPIADAPGALGASSG